MCFQERFRMILREKRLTQKQFAEDTGLTESAVSRYLSGNREPALRTLLTIREGLGCTWDELLGGPDASGK